MTDQRPAKVTTYLPAETKQSLREEAARQGMTLSAFIAKLLTERKATS